MNKPRFLVPVIVAAAVVIAGATGGVIWYAQQPHSVADCESKTDKMPTDTDAQIDASARFLTSCVAKFQ